MTQKFTGCCIVLLLFCLNPVYAGLPVVNHQIQVVLDPAQQTLQVVDRVTHAQQGNIDFTLHAGLNPRVLTTGVRLIKTGDYSAGPGGDIPFETYRVLLSPDQTQFTLSYSGKIAHDFSSRTESPGREQQLLSGTIAADGVFLDASVAWYPRIAGSYQTFNLSVSLPDGWIAVSQGEGPQLTRLPAGNRVTWQANDAQDNIYLIAGEYEFYAQNHDARQSQVFLRGQDTELAQRYLDVTDYYIHLYEELIGDYAYPKFALVENFWETGYGMPSFTLLGPSVIRLPFILHSSYPHEILHNWWGNGVFIDYSGGNWSEGLTAYLADHLIQEQQGQGIAYRRSALQRFASFVRTENDFPLRDFRSRHSSSSQAVGYAKSLMFFHMLRRKLGDKAFIQGIRQFYKNNLFSAAGFDDLRLAFEEAGQIELNDFFKQWLERTGAPAITLESIAITALDSGYRLQGTLRQTQESPAFPIDVPLLVYLEGVAQAQQMQLSMDNKTRDFSVDVEAKPLRMDIDPWFDLFRQLDEAELPPTLGRLFGRPKVLFVLPAQAEPQLRSAYLSLARKWARGYPSATIKFDNELDALPEGESVWLLGWQNQFFKPFQESFESTRFNERAGGFRLSGHDIDKSRHSTVLMQSGKQNQLIGWVGASNAKSLPGLTRKLPHYGKYSYLLFEGDGPAIQQKGQWSLTRSPLQFWFSDTLNDIDEAVPVPLWPQASQP